MSKKKITLSLGLVCILLPLFGQTIIEIPSLNSNYNQVIKDIPFDQKFILRIPYNPNYERIDYDVRIVDGEKIGDDVKIKDDKKNKKWYYHLGGYGSVFNKQENQPFQILMPPLHPNVEYNLSVKAVSKITFTSNPAFQKDMSDVLRKYLENNDNITMLEINLLKKEISNKIKEYSKHLEIYDYNGNVYLPDPFDENFGPISKSLIKNSDDIKSNSDVMDTSIEEIDVLLDPNLLFNFNEKIFKLSYLKDSLNEYSRLLLSEFVNPGIEPLKSISLESATKIIWKLLINGGNSLLEVLKGKLKIQENGIVASDKVDFESIFFINSFFQLINSNVITTKKNIPYFEENKLKVLLPKLLDNYLKVLNEKIKLLEDNNQLTTKLNNLVLNNYQVEDININLIPDVKLVPTKDSRYLGFDLGIGYAPFLKSIISFQGVNLYFTPVDQSIPLSNYRNRDIFLKRFSIFIGVAQFLESKDSKIEKGLISNYFSLGNPTLGFGYRLGNLLRFNLGAMAFKKSNLNATISTKNNYLTAFASVSIDIGFKDVLNTIANFF